VSPAVPKLTAMGDFQTLFDSLSENSQLRGRQFEHICKWFLENDPTYRNLVAKVWPWKDWEHNWGIDAGIDVVVEDVEGRLWAVQAKAYDPAYAVTKKDVDKFLSESSRARAKAKFDYRLLIATTDKLHHVARDVIADQEKKVGFVGLADLLTASVDWPASPDSLRPAKPRKPAKPRDYQRDAIKAVIKGFDTADRGQLIMACGTGKTLTSLFIKEKLGAERALVLLPSLSLLKQTMSEWRANTAAPFRALAVCSDETVKQSEDEPVTHTSELGIPDVTTDPAEVAAFLRKRGPAVVFATYHSSPQIADAFALGRVPQFDTVFADEAHRVAGDESSYFATILNADTIKARRRLFMTATPRYFTGRVIKKAKEAEMVVASMDDHTKFGEVFHKLSFGEAIRRGLLTDYQVAVIGVDSHDTTYREWAEKGTLVKRDGKATDGRILASQIGLAKAIQKYDMRRIISFHRTVARARQFKDEMPEVIAWMPKRQRPTGDLWTGVATGEMTAGERHIRLQRLRQLDDGERGLLTNARCLSEGVDVPTLDGVAFIDPKGSEVDIIQAVGRAIRLSSDKTVGTIVIPVFVEADQDPAEALNDSTFKAVWRVVTALRAHDEELAEQIDSFRRELGSGGKPRIPDKIHIDVTREVDKAFSDAFDVRLVEQTSARWEWWYGLLERYVAEKGTSRVPRDLRVDDIGLGGWVVNQRSLRVKGKLSDERARRLEALPEWTWNQLEAAWEEGFENLLAYIEAEGDSLVPFASEYQTSSGHQLGAWVTKQRVDFGRGTLREDRRQRLEPLPGWTWHVKRELWEDGIAHLLEYIEQNGHSLVPVRYRSGDGYSLGVWVASQRRMYAQGIVAAERCERLEAIPEWVWAANDARWEDLFRRLQLYVEATGSAVVTGAYPDPKDGYTLSRWVNKQRQKFSRGDLSAEQVSRLEALPGWSWAVHAGQWEEGFRHLEKYLASHRDAQVSTSYEDPDDGYKLGVWVGSQRRRWTKGTLQPDRVERLEAHPGWQWETFDNRWDEGFQRLEEYVKETGTARVGARHKQGGYPLGQWVNVQRTAYRDGTINAERQKRLEQLPEWSWNPGAERWESMFALLEEYALEFGVSHVPRARSFKGEKLGTWVANQRSAYSKGQMGIEQQRRFEALPGWTWTPGSGRWEKSFQSLRAYAEETGSVASLGDRWIEGVNLRSWVTNQRVSRGKGNLTPERQELLEGLPGWTWDAVETRWETMFGLLQQYTTEHGSSKVPSSYSAGDYKLGSWVSNQLAFRRKGKLSPERQRLLESLPGWEWEPGSTSWERAYALMTEYVHAHGDYVVPKSYSEAIGFELGAWVNTQRTRYGNGTLPEDRRRRLEELPGWVWAVHDAKWEQGFQRLREYVDEHGDTTMPTSYVVDGYRLGGWVAAQRSNYTKGVIKPDQQRKLEELPGWVWNALEARWEEGFRFVSEYIVEHQSANVPREYNVDGFRVGQWVREQRRVFGEGKMNEERQKRLESLPGWVWRAR
jgi:superfamily II DNA or RNA helicase